MSRVIRGPDEVSATWLSEVLGTSVASVQVMAGEGAWSRQISIVATLRDGDTRALRLKLCLGDTFGRSEVDYYTRDYTDMANAPLVKCLDAEYDAAVGYHLLLEDLAATHVDRRDAPPTRTYGLAVAEALGRLHRHHWGSMPPPDAGSLDRYFGEIRAGLAPLEHRTGRDLRARFERHEETFRRRWARPRGMSLLHGDLNPTNILTPRGADAPVYFLDRQPFGWSLTHGVAAWDLAYFLVPWWPESTRRECERDVLRCWYESLDPPDYDWAMALEDWSLSVEQCLHVPMEWCSRPETAESMRWLWEPQFARVLSAMA